MASISPMHNQTSTIIIIWNPSITSLCLLSSPFSMYINHISFHIFLLSFSFLKSISILTLSPSPLMSSTRSSLTAVPTIANIYISNPYDDGNALDKKPSSYTNSVSLTIDNNTDDLNTSRKSRCATIVSHLRHFKQKVSVNDTIADT